MACPGDCQKRRGPARGTAWPREAAPPPGPGGSLAGVRGGKGARASLRHVVSEAAALAPGTGALLVGYAGRKGEADAGPISRPCVFNPDDLVIGGIEQRALFVDLLGKAQRRMIIHSTFLDARRFEVLLEPIRAACERGVTID